MKNWIPKIKFIRFNFTAKEFRDQMAQFAAIFLLIQLIIFPFSKDVFLKMLASLIFFLGWLAKNETPKRILFTIGILLYMLIIKFQLNL